MTPVFQLIFRSSAFDTKYFYDHFLQSRRDSNNIYLAIFLTQYL